MLRAILVILIPIFTGCIAVDHERRGPERTVASHCVPTRTTASLDPSSKDRVRLLFDRGETCSNVREVVWITESETRLSVPARLGLGALATVVVAAPVMVAGRAGILAIPSDSGQRAAMEIGAPIGGVLAAGAGVAVYALSGGALGKNNVERVERVTVSGVLGEVPIVKGSFAIDGAAHPLRQGAVELSLAEASLLQKSALTLDGRRVDLATGSLARLAALPACQQALEDTPVNARLVKALECKAGGWTFADSVLAQR